jgi:DNA-binding winged helix-turn-helix (wHTH) protein
MKTGTGPERAGSLVVELAARTAIIDGVRIELPPTEFALLAVLSARPGQIVSHKELAAEAFGEGVSIAPHELHWRIWKLRDLVGDGAREHKMIENRRGQGYVLDMPTSAVEVLDGVAALPNTQEVIHLDDPSQPTAAQPSPADDEDIGQTDHPRRRLRMTAVLAGTAIAIAALGTSWAAGYLLSRSRGDDAVTTEGTAPDSADEATDKTTHKPRERRRHGKPERRNSRRKSNPGTTVVASGPSTSYSSGADEDAPTATKQEAGTGGEDQKQEAPAPPPPQPDAQLYHLFDPDSGDHFVTTSSSVANQKQAAGYTATVEGGVFSSQEKGTTAISLDSGTAYVYREPGSAPKGVSLATLYKLSLDDDFFYTSSSSAANQAQAEGWTRSTVGYVTA